MGVPPFTSPLAKTPRPERNGALATLGTRQGAAWARRCCGTHPGTLRRPDLENEICQALDMESEQPVPDDFWMALALEQAKQAYAEDEVPIGAVVVGLDPGAGAEPVVLGAGRNATRHDCDVSSHAEVLAIRSAAQKLGYQRLEGCTLYTTIEPCFMCAGAALHARLKRVVFGAPDPKFGGTVSLGRVFDTVGLNHHVLQEGGVRAEEARELMQGFFRAKRKAKK